MLMSCLIKFTRPVNFDIFISNCVAFAQFDIFSAQDFFADNFKFVETTPFNNQFDFYGIGNKVMLINSGSYFVL